MVSSTTSLTQYKHAIRKWSMSLRIGRRLALRLPRFQQLFYGMATLLVATSSLLSLASPHAHADVPLYTQESPGFGDRKYIGNNYSFFALDSNKQMFVSMNIGNNNFIRKFASDGTFLKDFTLPNLMTASNASYQRLAVDSLNNLFVINSYDNTIVVFDNDGIYQRTISSIPSGSADFVFDHLDNYYLTDSANNRVQKFSHDGTFLYNVGGPSAGSSDGQFNNPLNLAVDSQNNLVVADAGNSRIQVFTNTGAFIRKFGQATSGIMCPPQPSLGNMGGLTIDQSDNLYIATHQAWCNTYVQKYTVTGTYIATLTYARYSSYLRTAADNTIYSAEYETYISGQVGGSTIARYDTSGNVLTSRFIGGPDKLAYPCATAQDSAGNTYVADVRNYRIQKYDINHNPVLTIGSYGSGNGQFQSIASLAIDKNNVIYASDYSRDNIQKFSTDGTYLGSFGSQGTTDGQFQYLDKIAVRSDGTIAALDGRYVGNSRIQFFKPDGTFLNKITAGGIVSFALKSDDSVTVFTSYSSYGSSSYYLKQFNTSNTEASSTYASFYDSATNSSFLPYVDIAYDQFDNLYTLGRDTRNPQSVTTVARLNITNPDLPPYEVIVPILNDSSARLSFTSSNQMLITSPYASYVYQYDVASTLKAPNTPVNLTSTPTAHSLSLSWQAPTGPTILKYLIEYRPHATMQWIRHEATTATSSIIDGLLQDTYDVRVTAMNQAGTGTPAEHDGIAISSDYNFKQMVTPPNNAYIQGVVFGPDGRRYESDYSNDVINIYGADGSFIKSFGTSGYNPGQLNGSRQGAITGGKLYIPSYNNERVDVFDLDGNYLSSFGSSGTGDGQMSYPSQVYADKDGTLFVVSEYSNIQHYDKDGNYLGRFASDLAQPISMTRDEAGNYYVANYGSDSSGGIYKYNASGTNILHFGSYGEGVGQMYEVTGMAINKLGQLVINDTYNYRVGFYTTDGTFLYNIGRGYGYEGEYLMFDGALTIAQAPNGDLYLPNGWSPYMTIFGYTGSQGTTTPPAASVPTSPRSVTVTSTNANTLTATWQSPADNGGSVLIDYVFEYKPAASSTWSQLILAPTATNHTLTNVPAGTYDIRISASNASGTSVPSTVATTAVADPSVLLPVAPTPTTQTTTPTITIAPSTPYVAPLSPTQSHRPNQSSDTTTSDSQSPPQILRTQIDTKNPSSVTVTWQPPAGKTPTGYIIEYRDASVSPDDTTTSWRQAAITGPNDHSGVINLPSGQYNIRVAAVVPGEPTGRIILAVARVTITTPTVEGDGQLKGSSASAATPTHTIRSIILVCVGLLTLAFLFIIPILWKRRRRKQTPAAIQLPPRRW